MKRIQIPQEARYIIEQLNQHGYEAYVVGGCVRDSLLGKEPKDWDITTSAKPQEVKEIFRRTIDTGIQHGTVTVRVNHENYEVTTYRIDGKYSDHRRPESVEFTVSLEEDLKRRDFTINAMAYNDEEGVIDYFQGMEDLERGIIRCVGIPQERFDEDALRILRGLRFSAQLGFVLEEQTCKAIEEKVEFLRDISAERIQVELTKLICSPHPEYLEQAYALGVTAVVLPEYDAMRKTKQNNVHHCYDVGTHCLLAMQHVECDHIMRWAALLHDSGKPRCLVVGEDGQEHFYGHSKVGAQVAVEVLRRLKMDNETIRQVKTMIAWHDYGIGQEVTKTMIRRWLNQVGEELVKKTLDLQQGDAMGKNPLRRDSQLEGQRKVREALEEILQEQHCFNLKMLKMDGASLKAMGVAPGPDMGRILKALLEDVLEHPEHNEEEYLKTCVLKLLEP